VLPDRVISIPAPVPHIPPRPTTNLPSILSHHILSPLLKLPKLNVDLLNSSNLFPNLYPRAPPPLLQPSPMGLDEPLPASSNSSNSSNSSTGSQEDVDMPDLSDEDIPSPNYMFDMPNSSDESSPEDPTISDPNHPNYRPLLTWEPLDRSRGQPVQIVPPRRPEPPSPDGPPGTP
jgi:hypothetical protein